jgi:hypothetical protein
MIQLWWRKIRRALGWESSARPLNLYCANCGERLTQRHFCRACGASEESGWAAPDWSEDSEDEDFDYDDFVRREFGDGRSRSQGLAATAWGTLIIVLLVVGLLLAQFGGWLF